MIKNDFSDIDIYFKAKADFVYYFGRTSLEESDEYYDEALPLYVDNKYTISTTDLVIIQPIGTKWESYYGWRSFFGIPIFINNNWWLAIGKHIFEFHPRRGPYPLAKAYLFDLSQENKLSLISKLINDFLSSNYKYEPTNMLYKLGIHRTNSANPIDHLKIEQNVWKLASSKYENSQLFHFRTLLISDDLLPDILIDKDDYSEPMLKLYRKNKDYLIIKNHLTKPFINNAYDEKAGFTKESSNQSHPYKDESNDYIHTYNSKEKNRCFARLINLLNKQK